MKKRILQWAAVVTAIATIGVFNVASAAITLKNKCAASTAAATTTVLNCSLGTVTTGDTVIILMNVDAVVTSTIVDSHANVYVTSTYQNIGGGEEFIWYNSNVTGGASFSVTSTFATSVPFTSIIALEYGGLATSRAVDATGTLSTLSNASTTLTTSAASTTQPGDLLVGISDGSVGPGSITAGPGFTTVATSTGTASIAESTTTLAAGSTVSATFVANTTAQLFVADFTAFKAAASNAMFFAGD